MVSEGALRTILLFFFYSLMSDRLARSAAQKTLRRWLRSAKKTGQTGQEEDFAELVRIGSAVFRKYAKKNEGVGFESRLCDIPKDLSLSDWREFRRRASEEEFLAVLWAKVLRVPESRVAAGLEVTEGTVRYRLNRGLRLLGSLCGEASHV